jgi:hypothetical protein
MTDQQAAIERRFLGVVEVDSGTLLVGDPCYALPDAAKGKPGIDYAAVTKSLNDENADYLDERPVLLLQNFGGDGTFPVFGEFDGGELVGIWINLDPAMEEGEED